MSSLLLSICHPPLQVVGLWRVAVMEVEVVMCYGPRFQQPNGRVRVLFIGVLATIEHLSPALQVDGAVGGWL